MDGVTNKSFAQKKMCNKYSDISWKSAAVSDTKQSYVELESKSQLTDKNPSQRVYTLSGKTFENKSSEVMQKIN